MTALDAPSGQVPGSIMRHRPFALFWSARVLSSGAFHMQAVAVGWQVYAMTDSALALGLLGLVQFVPMVVLTLLVGHMADRYDRRAIASICQLVNGTVALVLTVGTFGGWLGVDAIFALVAVVGAARAFESPTMAALLTGLVPEGLIARATAWSASANQTAQILGPAAGGLLYAIGPTVAFATACACFLIAGTASALIRATRTARAREPLTLESLFGGIRFVRGQPIILGTLSLDLFAVLLGGAIALLPIYARDILETGPWGLGVLRASPALGALAMSVALAHFPLEGRIGPKLFGAVIVFGLATIVFGLSTNLLLSIAALMVLGAADVISVVIRFSLVQLRTPDEMRGRVSALNSLFIGTSNQLGEFESGVTAALFGAVPAVLLGGAGTILVALLWMRWFPELRRIEKL
jgi:MFS family permease